MHNHFVEDYDPTIEGALFTYDQKFAGVDALMMNERGAF
jgi:hypothetical protein